MKYAILADIHANLEALQAVLQDMKLQGCTHAACWGETYSKFRIERDKTHLVNPGSVGQPRDGNPKAAYVTYDLEDAIIELRRVDYDIPGAQEKLVAAGLPRRPQ